VSLPASSAPRTSRPALLAGSGLVFGTVGGVLLLGVMAGPVRGQGAGPVFDREIAGIVVGQDRLDAVIARYGDAPQYQLRDGVGVCYHSVQENAYLVLSGRANDRRVDYVLVTTVEEAPPALPCPGGVLTHARMATGSGIGLGDPPGRVARAYAEPGRTRLERDGTVATTYRGPGLTASFWFRDNRLVRMTVATDS
jgi:hypothetical protein